MFDEWSNEKYDEWDDFSISSYDNEPRINLSHSFSEKDVISGKYPEVEIGSSSDEEAPPVPSHHSLHVRTWS